MARVVAGPAVLLILGAVVAAWGEESLLEGPSPPLPQAKPAEAPPVPAATLEELTTAAHLQRATAATIRAALLKRTNVDFQETPLGDTLEFLRNASGIPFLIDTAALQENGIEKDVAIRFSAGDATVSQILRRILEPHGLTTVVRDEVLLVTTQVKADGMLETRTYDVRRIARALREEAKADESAAAVQALTAATTGASPDDDSALLSLTSLVQNLTSGPWQNIQGDGGQVTAGGKGDVLAIRQTQRVHDEIAPLLRGLDALLDGKLRHGAVVLRPEAYSLADDARLREALALRIPNVEFMETPLRDAVHFLQDVARVRILIDETSLQEEGVGLDDAVTLWTKSLTLQSNLTLALEPLALTTVIDDGLLLVTTRVKADERLHSVLYDVRDLGALIARGRLVDMVMNETSGPWQDTQGDGGTIDQTLSGALVVRQTDKVHAEIALLLHDLRATIGPEALADGAKEAAKPAGPTEEELAVVELQFYPLDRKGLAAEMHKSILAFVEPATWSANGGDGTILAIGETLAVKNTKKVHRAIRKFLDDLKAAEDAPPK